MANHRVVSYRIVSMENSQLSLAVVRFSFSARFDAVHCPPSFLIAISIYNQCQRKYVQKVAIWLHALPMIVIRIESIVHACVNSMCHPFPSQSHALQKINITINGCEHYCLLVQMEFNTVIEINIYPTTFVYCV